MELEDIDIPEHIPRIDEGSLRVVRRGYVADHEHNLLVTAHQYDGHPLKFSQKFLERRDLHKGNPCAVVEYRVEGEFYVDVWKI